jgi:hypothetical protein
METVNMRTTRRARILLVGLVCIFAAISLIVARTTRYSRAIGNANAPAPNYRVEHSSSVAIPDSGDYRELLTNLESERAELAVRFRQTTSEAQKARIVTQAREAVVRSLNAIFPNWYGTGWDFNGTTEVPGQGKIACGYFVTTVLRDAGWKVQRARLAQQASENIILSLTAESYIKRFRRIAIGDFVKTVREWGPGIFVVGLDVHTGFIVNDGNEVYFIHASYVEPFAVVKEKALESKILQASRYRVLGKITADPEFIEKWLLRKEITTRVG